MSTITPYVFDRFFSTPSWNWTSSQTIVAEEITQLDDGSYKIDIEVPGYSKEHIDIVAKEGYLFLVLKQENKKERKLTYRLSPKIDPTKITANCKNGILTVLCPIHETAKPVSIKVS